MKFTTSILASTLLLSGFGASHLVGFQQTPAADNTKVNERDRAKNEPTADQAKDNVSDRELMQQIRKAIMADKALSTYGKNVKVIAQHGKVTLKGPVHTEDERTNIEAKAVQIAGPANVTNQLAVNGDNK
jgi:hyperosmotically inducible periplasmic protein